jgi:hypothetical protein
MLVMGMALAGNAAAALLWLVCLKGVGLTKYENSKCLKANGGPPSENGWQSLGLLPGQSITVKILVISLKLEDSKTLLGASGAKCPNSPELTGIGLIEPPNKGKILVAKMLKAGACAGFGGCKEIEELEGENLSWETEIVEGPGGAPLTKIKSHSGGGKPGWKVKCSTIAGPMTDICEEESAPEEVKLTFGEVTENPEKIKELLIRGLFQENRAHCTLGGAGAGRVSGTVAILLPGGALSINKV